jgi:hypothetical protein
MLVFPSDQLFLGEKIDDLSFSIKFSVGEIILNPFIKRQFSENDHNGEKNSFNHIICNDYLILVMKNENVFFNTVINWKISFFRVVVSYLLVIILFYYS